MVELKTSQYISIDGKNNVIYEFDGIVRFVIRSYFSSLQAAMAIVAGDILNRENLCLAKENSVLFQKGLEKIEYQLLSQTLKNKEIIEKKLKWYVSTLLATTNELRAEAERLQKEILDFHEISRFMEILGLNETIHESVIYYNNRFSYSLPIDPHDEEIKFKKSQTGFHIDSWCISQALPLVFFDTLTTVLTNRETLQSVELKAMFSDLLAVLFAEINYAEEDMQYVENEISMSRSNKYKMEVGCRFPEVTKLAVETIEGFYSDLFSDSKVVMTFFDTEESISPAEYRQLKEKYKLQVGINESLQIIIDQIKLKNSNQNGARRKPLHLPELLDTEEAHNLWKKLKDAKLIDDNYQSKVSKPKSAIIANAIGIKLGIDESKKWIPFEELWGNHYMSNDYIKAMKANYYDSFSKKINNLLNLK